MKYTINLLPQPEQTLIDKIVYFAFHYLRYILVITQFVVICVFFFRFKVDQEIVDLKDAISQKREIINATSTLLEEVEVVDGKLNVTGEILEEQDKVNSMLQYFIDSIPANFRVTRVTVLPDSIDFRGESRDIDTIQVFYDTLNNEQRFEEVVFEDVTRTVDSYSFSFRLINFKSESDPNET
jgi:hypothetical protein